jgi:hypothetical protein
MADHVRDGRMLAADRSGGRRRGVGLWNRLRFWAVLALAVLAPLLTCRWPMSDQALHAELDRMNEAGRTVARWQAGGQVRYVRTPTGATAYARVAAAEWSHLSTRQREAVVEVLRGVTWSNAKVDRSLILDEDDNTLLSG